MNDLTELRGALTDQADGLDGDRPGRLGELHDRVRGVRRRRRRVAAAGVAAALVVAFGVVGLTRDAGQPPDEATTVVGLTPPATLDSLGFGYDLVDGVDGTDGRAQLRLPASPEPRLVSWATSGDDQRVQLAADAVLGPGVTTTDVADFSDWVVVPAGEATTVFASSATGEPGLAVYALGDRRPEGYTAQGVTFRRSTSEGELLGAAVGEPGTAEVTTPDLRAPGGEVSLAYFCSGGPRDAFLHLATGDDGEVVAGRGCDDLARGDVSSILVGFDRPEGADLTTRLYVTRGVDGPLLDDPDVLVGLGLYDAAEPVQGVAPQAEAGGHRWTLSDVTRARPGQRRLEASVPEGAPEDESAGTRLVVVFAGGAAGNVLAVVDRGGPRESRLTISPSGSSTEVLRPGADIVMRSATGDGRFGVAVYSRAD